jgi:PAS domain S-box-containing protein
VAESAVTPVSAPELQPPSWRAALGAPAIALVALLGYSHFRGAANSHLFADRPALIADSVCFGAANLGVIYWTYLAARSARGEPATRRAWLLIMIASMGNAFGSITWSVYQIVFLRQQLQPWINVIFSAAYVFSVAGLVYFPSAPRRRADRLTFLFDITTIALSGAMIFWYWCVRTGAFVGSTTFASQALVVGYPSADLAVLIAAAMLLVRSADGRNRRIFGFIGLAYLCSAVGDFWYGYLTMEGQNQRNTLIDVFWLAGIVFLMVAAKAQLEKTSSHESARVEATTTWMAEIPLVAVALAFAMLFLAMRENRESAEVQLGVGALIMTVLAMARQRISAREAARLMDERATRDARFRALVQHSSDVVLVLDASLNAAYVSPAVEGVLGYRADAWANRAFVDWVAPDDREAAAELLARVAASPFAIESLRCRMVHADGTPRCMETVASNLLDDAAVRGIVLNSRDITQRTALEEQLQHTQKLEVVGRLAGGIAHDFNNLLMVIGANAEFVLSDDGDVATSREAAHEIKETTKRAAALTKQLLAFSRRQDTRPAVLDPNVVVSHVERMLLRLMQHAARFEIDLTEHPWAIEMDPGQLEQALLNLAVNARDAMPSGGLFIMRTRNVELAERMPVDRGVLAPGNYVAISVRDTGHGMTSEVRSRLFEPFFTTKAIGSGTGLGLAMVLGVVQQAGGQIHVESMVGKGTTITLYLPVARGAAVSPVTRAEAGVVRGTWRILVVDDEEGVRTALQRLLRRLGYEVEAVGDATTALALLGAVPLRFDLVLSDILMPDKNGLELATELLEAGVPVAIVLMTGFADSATVREATETHRLPVLRKPFEVDQLAVIVEDALFATCALRTAS